MEDKGHCPHGEFDIHKGCKLCIAERRLTGTLSPDTELTETVTETITMSSEDLLPSTALALRPGEDVEVHSYYQEALKLYGYASARIIDTFEDVKSANNDLSLISKIKKAMEGKKKEYLDPLKVQMDAIRDTYNYLMAPVLEADKITRDKMLAFNLKQKLIKEEQERINALRLEAAQKEMELTGELSESVNLVEVIPEVPKHIRTEMGTASTFKVRKWEIVDFALVPNELKLIDAGKVTKLVKAGIGSIEGLRIWEEDSLRITAR